jgi:hypothetical protein
MRARGTPKKVCTSPPVTGVVTSTSDASRTNGTIRCSCPAQALSL